MSAYLYPPIIDDYQTAFTVEKKQNYDTSIELNIKEQASSFDINFYYNNDINNLPKVNNKYFIFLRVIDPSTGIDLLKNKVSLLYIQQDNISPNEKGRITVSKDLFIEDAYEVNKSFQCRLRLFSGEIDIPAEENLINENNWLQWMNSLSLENKDLLSNWSKAIIFSSITYADKYIEYTDEQYGNIILNREGNQYLRGTFECPDDDLFWYTVQIYTRNYADVTNIDNANILLESERIYPIDKNIISYAIPQDILTTIVNDAPKKNIGTCVSFLISFKTVKGYIGTQLGALLLNDDSRIDGSQEVQVLDVFATPNGASGLIELSFIVQNITREAKTGILYIERTDSFSNYEKWENWKSIGIKLSNNEEKYGVVDSSYNLFLQDLFVEQGRLYKYRVRVEWEKDSDIYVSNYGETESPVAIVFEDIFLMDKDVQVRIKYNPQITSLKRNVIESITPTLEGKYPVVRRNGKAQYYSFILNGLISYKGELRENNESIYGSFSDSRKKNSYTTSPFEGSLFFNTDSNILDFDENLFLSFPQVDQEILCEKAFRKKFIDFLYDGEVKVFKSPTEELMLVRLTNISLTPNTQLGRNIYSFSATVTEVLESSLDNYNLYIQKIPVTYYQKGYYLLAEEVLNKESLFISDSEVLSFYNGESQSNDWSLILNEELTNQKGLYGDEDQNYYVNAQIGLTDLVTAYYNKLENQYFGDGDETMEPLIDLSKYKY